MTKKKDEAEKKGGKKPPTLATLRGAKMATATASGPSGKSAVTLRVGAGAAIVPPSGMWDNYDGDETAVPPPSLELAPPMPVAISKTAPRPQLVVESVRPIEESRSGVLPKRHLSISPARHGGRSPGISSRSPSPAPRRGRSPSKRGRR